MNKFTLCPGCSKNVDAVDHYCRWCGKALHSGAIRVSEQGPAGGPLPPPVAGTSSSHLANPSASPADAIFGTPTQQDPPRKMSDNPWVVVLLLFLVLGPFGLPVLWRSRGFTRHAKIGLTVIVLGISIYAFWYMYTAIYQPLMDQLKDIQGLSL